VPPKQATGMQTLMCNCSLAEQQMKLDKRYTIFHNETIPNWRSLHVYVHYLNDWRMNSRDSNFHDKESIRLE
jgi:hypothetical protein